MSHVRGQQDADLHYVDGSHRSTPPTADGRVVATWEARIRRHLDAHADVTVRHTHPARHSEAIEVLTELRDSLPVEHHERPGVIRAIELLRSEVT